MSNKDKKNVDNNVKEEKNAEVKLTEKESFFSLKNMKVIAVSATKILLPAIALVIVIATIVSLVHSKKDKEAENAANFTEESSTTAVSSAVLSEPLKENAYPEVNQLINAYCTALADGDLDTIQSLKDYNSEKELLTYEKKSEYIESYNNVTCYTKDGMESGTYYVYVYYNVKFKDIDTMTPGLIALYVYTNADGVLQIDGDLDERVTAALKLVTSQDDVVDLYNKVDVEYKEAVASDEALNTMLQEIPKEIKTSVGIALAKLEEETQAETEDEVETTQTEQETQTGEEQPQTQTVNQQVRATDTVNVRSSDSEEADKIGKAQKGEVLTRTEEKINGWSKVIYEGKEAYIKSDYLEVISTDSTGETPVGTVKAKTNVNVRNAASQDAEKIGVAQGESTYTVLEDMGEWLKIDYNGKTGYVKAEYFE